MREVPIYEARQTLGQLVDEVNAAGETVAVTKHGRRVALLVPMPVDVPVVGISIGALDPLATT